MADEANDYEKISQDYSIRRLLKLSEQISVFENESYVPVGKLRRFSAELADAVCEVRSFDTPLCEECIEAIEEADEWFEARGETPNDYREHFLRIAVLRNDNDTNNHHDRSSSITIPIGGEHFESEMLEMTRAQIEQFRMFSSTNSSAVNCLSWFSKPSDSTNSCKDPTLNKYYKVISYDQPNVILGVIGISIRFLPKSPALYIFNEYDYDHDGSLSRSEFAAFVNDLSIAGGNIDRLEDNLKYPGRNTCLGTFFCLTAPDTDLISFVGMRHSLTMWAYKPDPSANLDARIEERAMLAVMLILWSIAVNCTGPFILEIANEQIPKVEEYGIVILTDSIGQVFITLYFMLQHNTVIRKCMFASNESQVPNTYEVNWHTPLRTIRSCFDYMIKNLLQNIYRLIFLWLPVVVTVVFGLAVLFIFIYYQLWQFAATFLLTIPSARLLELFKHATIWGIKTQFGAARATLDKRRSVLSKDDSLESSMIFPMLVDFMEKEEDIKCHDDESVPHGMILTGGGGGEVFNEKSTDKELEGQSIATDNELVLQEEEESAAKVVASMIESMIDSVAGACSSDTYTNSEEINIETTNRTDDKPLTLIPDAGGVEEGKNHYTTKIVNEINPKIFKDVKFNQDVSQEKVAEEADEEKISLLKQPLRAISSALSSGEKALSSVYASVEKDPLKALSSVMHYSSDEEDPFTTLSTAMYAKQMKQLKEAISSSEMIVKAATRDYAAYKKSMATYKVQLESFNKSKRVKGKAAAASSPSSLTTSSLVAPVAPPAPKYSKRRIMALKTMLSEAKTMLAKEKIADKYGAIATVWPRPDDSSLPTFTATDHEATKEEKDSDHSDYSGSGSGGGIEMRSRRTKKKVLSLKAPQLSLKESHLEDDNDELLDENENDDESNNWCFNFWGRNQISEETLSLNHCLGRGGGPVASNENELELLEEQEEKTAEMRVNYGAVNCWGSLQQLTRTSDGSVNSSAGYTSLHGSDDLELSQLQQTLLRDFSNESGEITPKIKKKMKDADDDSDDDNMYGGKEEPEDWALVLMHRDGKWPLGVANEIAHKSCRSDEIEIELFVAEDFRIQKDDLFSSSSSSSIERTNGQNLYDNENNIIDEDKTLTLKDEEWNEIIRYLTTGLKYAFPLNPLKDLVRRRGAFDKERKSASSAKHKFKKLNLEDRNNLATSKAELDSEIDFIIAQGGDMGRVCLPDGFV